MNAAISLNEMRERVGRAVFGDDWLGGVSQADWELIRGHYGIRHRNEPTAAGIRPLEIKPCPKTIAASLDRAIGRAARADAQYSTVDSWIEDRGLPIDPRISADRAIFNRILHETRSDSGLTSIPIRRGPKPRILNRIVEQMQNDLSEKKITRSELATFLEKELADRYQATRERVRTAREWVLQRSKNN
jgi:hypothetical protein